jgi:hypothetical protein
MTKVSKKLALMMINKLPLSKEEKAEIKKGVLKELELVKNMDSKQLQNRLKGG